MEKIDLSANSKKLQSAYASVVEGYGSNTYAVFEVTKNGVADVSSTGTGSLEEFVEEFHDGQVQFGFARVTVPGSDVFKNILLGWCPDNAPLKLRTSFAANFADVSRVFSGYHVQITARDNDDLDPDEFLSRVGAAAGARYTYHTSTNTTAKATAPTPVKLPQPSRPNTSSVSASVASQPPKPKVFGAPAPAKPSSVVQPKFGAKPTFGSKPPIAAKPALNFAPKQQSSLSDNDGWGDEKEIEERDFLKQPLEDVPSAYKPTKVDIEHLRSQKSDTISSVPKPNKLNEPVDTTTAKDHLKTINSVHEDGRLSSLPKPKVSNNVASRYNPTIEPKQPVFGSKPAFGSAPVEKEKPEGVFQIHGNENGLTPAQAWAQKRGKYKIESDQDDAPVTSATAALSLGSKGKESEEDEEEEQPEEVEEEEEEKEEPVPVKPSVILPQRSLPPRNIEPILPKRAEPVPKPQQEESEEEEIEEEQEVVPPPVPILPSRTETPSVTLPSAVAQYDYEKDEDNEVEFVEGDLIIEIDFVDEEWWSGKNSRTGEIGVFPASYVALNESLSETSQKEEPVVTETTKPSGQSAVAEYDYDKEEDNEISFKEGDLIVEIEFIDLDWWSGKHSVSGETGVFPGNYVKLQ